MNADINQQICSLSDDIFRPHAQEADQGNIAGRVGQNIRLLANSGFFGLGIPKEFGGMEADEETRREYLETIASACGVTAFVQQQLHAGGGFVGGVEDDSLRKEWLPRFASGEQLCGVAFSHLRRPGPPAVTAREVTGGYIINGTAPWVTGWSLLDAFILGASIPESDSHVFVVVRKGIQIDFLTPSLPIPLAVMNASDTVILTINEMFIPKRDVLYMRPADSLRHSDLCGVTGHVFLPLGCVRGSIWLLRSLAERPGKYALTAVADAFQIEADACRREALRWNGSCVDLADYKQRSTNARSAAIFLAMRAAHAAVTASAGSGILLSNPAQRLLREAVFYTTTAQTADVQASTLDLLISPTCWQVD